MRGYPTNIQRRALGDDYSTLVSLNLDVDQLPVSRGEPMCSPFKEAIDEIEIYLSPTGWKPAQ